MTFILTFIAILLLLAAVCSAKPKAKHKPKKGFEPPIVMWEPPLAGDVDGDWVVDQTDLDIIIANWGMSPATREDGDLNTNGVVDGPDYAEVLSYWGEV